MKDKYIAFRVDDKEFDFIQVLARERGLDSVSALMRKALDEYIKLGVE